MTTANAEVRVMPIPGTVVLVVGYPSMEDSLFGLTTSVEFFRENAEPRMLKRFDDQSSKPEGEIFVPILAMTENFSFRLQFRQWGSLPKLSSLLDDEETFNKFLLTVRCFSYRDGSRYYAKFFDQLLYYLGFLDGRKKLGDFSYMKENPLERKYVEHLMKWREEQQKGFDVCTPS